MSAAAQSSGPFGGSREDEILVQQCLDGNENAWSALIDKYKSLVFSIPVKYGFATDDANEIFQAVCLTLLRELSHVREPRALAAWLIRVTIHKCKRHRRNQRACVDIALNENSSTETEPLPEEIFQQLEREHILKATIKEQSLECKQLLDLLFLHNPPLRYEEAASALGLAKGSIGATRSRCLKRFKQILQNKGFC